MPKPDPNDTVTTGESGAAAPQDTAGAEAAGAQSSGAEPGGQGAMEPVADVSAELAAARAEAAATHERFMRAAADLENFRRRTVREKDELRAIVTARVLEDILPVVDNLVLAIAAAKQPNAEIKSLTGGVEMVLAQLKAALASHGAKEINPVGQPFDPHQHEAISHLPSEEVQAEHVANVVRTGFAIEGRLIRPASVVVSSGPAAGQKKS
jgi:molecular chaperone GrpE